jgi:hypothetical protein
MKHDQMYFDNTGTGRTFPPYSLAFFRRSTGSPNNINGNNDPTLDAMIDSIDRAATEGEA